MGVFFFLSKLLNLNQLLWAKFIKAFRRHFFRNLMPFWKLFFFQGICDRSVFYAISFSIMIFSPFPKFLFLIKCFTFSNSPCEIWKESMGFDSNECKNLQKWSKSVLYILLLVLEQYCFEMLRNVKAWHFWHIWQIN